MQVSYVPINEIRSDQYCTGAVRHEIESGFKDLIPSVAKTELAKVSQWGLKELWLNVSPVKSGNVSEHHTRWAHSVGVLTIASLWYLALYKKQRDTLDSWAKRLGLRDAGALGRLVRASAIMHDLGHLPFAHLLGEVLETINWVAPGNGLSGLEGEVLRQRFDDASLEKWWIDLGSALGCPSDVAKQSIIALISGEHGLPWLQAIVNSPVDADKLDYVQRDSVFLREHTRLVGGRIPPSGRQPEWLEAFFAEQKVNHAGFLCLEGNSAVLAADLMRDRVFLNDRFYLSPEIRAADRMAFEIVQQFVIRAVMSEAFFTIALSKACSKSVQIADAATLRAIMGSNRTASDIRSVKCELASRLLMSLGKLSETCEMEFSILEFMFECLAEDRHVDGEVKGLWEKCYEWLSGLRAGATGAVRSAGSDDGADSKGQLRAVSLSKMAGEVIVGEPLVLARNQYWAALEIVRPLQHVYGRHVLIDIVKMPRALGVGRRWRGRNKDDADCQILVPAGPISRWGPGSIARQPLSDEAVRELERPYARIIVISPRGNRDVHVEYIRDRVRTALLEGGVRLVRKVRAS